MRTTERKHLKGNELADLLTSAQSFADTWGRQLRWAGTAVILVVILVVGVNAYRARSASQGTALLGEALAALNARVVPVGATAGTDIPAAAQLGSTGTFRTEAEKLTAALPKLQAAADAYPSSDAGIQARYYLGGALASLGRHDQAIKEFDDVTGRAGRDSLYGLMSRMGKADAQARSGQIDAAIASWKELAAQANADVPQDAVLMELARAYVQKGNTEEARKTFSQLVEQHPASPYAPEARQEIENLKG
jgi:tetratricopeptide (TPR) repeat protein